MAITLDPLPYAYDALSPNLSAETLKVHHDKHHQAYVDMLNKLIDGTEYATLSLTDIVIKSAPDSKTEMVKKVTDAAPTDAEKQAKIFNNAAQIWNHDFYWHSLTPSYGTMPDTLKTAIERDFGSVETFKEKFTTAGKDQFGSGWAWLVYSEGKLGIMRTGNADTPVARGVTPLLTCDVWEHAYYIDYQNRRPDYVTAFWNVINWNEVAKRFSAAK